jgi:hypothetical protein
MKGMGSQFSRRKGRFVLTAYVMPASVFRPPKKHIQLSLVHLHCSGMAYKTRTRKTSNPSCLTRFFFAQFRRISSSARRMYKPFLPASSMLWRKS